MKLLKERFDVDEIPLPHQTPSDYVTRRFNESPLRAELNPGNWTCAGPPPAAIPVQDDARNQPMKRIAICPAVWASACTNGQKLSLAARLASHLSWLDLSPASHALYQ